MINHPKIHTAYGRIKGVNVEKIRAGVMGKIKKLKKLPDYLRKHKERYGIFFVLCVMLFVYISQILQPFLDQQAYALGSANSLLPVVNDTMAGKLTYDSKQQLFSFNDGEASSSTNALGTGAQQISAAAYQDPSKGLTVTDPTNNIDLSMTPKYSLLPGKQDSNRVVYPFNNGLGWTVYTMQGTGVKEDIILRGSSGNTATFDYKLGLGNTLEARMEADGSVGVYGNTLFSGNITTSTSKDAALLQKARQNAAKNTFLFDIPKPIVLEKGNVLSSAKASFMLQGDDLKINVTGLKKANYPLTIDPSIYIVTAQQFMNGNDETNIYFDTADKLIEKGKTTGARFNTWNSAMGLPTSEWGGSSVAAGGFIYSVGGTTFPGQVYNTQGTDTFTVPSGVSSITVKMWGGGGGGGGGSSTTAGAAGGGAGYVTGTLAVTNGEILTAYVGGGGAGGVVTTDGGGGGGGGYSSLYQSTTPLAIAAGGGGGGGTRSTSVGGVAGAGGGTTGVAGTASGVAGAGGAGTPTTGGSAGTGGSSAGVVGSSLTGGRGGNTGGVAGGLASGGAGGLQTTTLAGGGGGGAGYFGGGGGSQSSTSSGGGGGGGGSSYTNTLTGVTDTAGSGTSPGNSGDSSRNGAGNGGGGGAIGANGTTGSTGLVIISYGSGTAAATQSVDWAKFDATTGAIDSANPGSGTCSGWCTTAAYNLPAARSHFSLVAYNGFLYAFGGIDASGTTQNTVYIAKLGANGEPQLWSPTDTNKADWVYWYSGATLSSIRSDMSAVAYNNTMYLMGGLSTGGTPVSTMETASITPTGTLGTWTSSTALPSVLYGQSSQVYNDRLYILGGDTSVGGAPSNSVYYNKINSDGTLNSWTQTTSFATGRLTEGGNFTAAWGAYIYISGGCSAVNASGYCTTVQSDTQLASINADGSLDVWNTVGGVTNEQEGFSMVAWSNNIYEIGGCSAQNTTTGDCNASMQSGIDYGTINQDGDASTVNQTVASGTAPCSGGSPNSCNLPSTTYIGNMLSAAVITNGYLYVIGGCTNVTCSTTSTNVAYVSISSTGVMTAPATCAAGTFQNNIWCVDTTHTITGGIAAASPVVFGGQIYLVGGLNGTANTNAIVRTTYNTDGSITAWTSQSMTGVGATSESYLYAYSRANPSTAGTYPGNLYIFGGCSTSSAAGCTAYSQVVDKCNIAASTGAISACSTTSQQQIGIIPGDTQVGLGIMSGTVYAGYIYLIGGVSPNQTDLKTVRYAKFDNNNNVVSANGSGTWVESPNQMSIGRRRAAAFGYNGYIYVVGGYDGTTGHGVLADIEFIKVNVSDGSLGTTGSGFNVSAVTINQRWGLSVPVSNSFAYVIGGCTTGDAPSNCTALTNVVQTFQIYNNDDGSPAGYSTSANTFATNPNRIGASTTILNGYIYVAGGCTSTTDCTTAVSTVSYAPIDVYGNVGAWTNTTAALPAVRTWGKLETVGGSLYYIGGQSSTATDWRTEVYYATPSSGQITTWGTATDGLLAGRSQFGAAVWNNRIYVLGGEGTTGTGCANNVCNTVYSSPQLNSGGNITTAWSSSNTSFNVDRSGLTAITYANNIYIYGGYDSANYLSDSQYAQISTTTGLISGSWSYTTSLPAPLSQADGFAYNGYMYLIGGRSSATSCDPETLVAPISANTTIASGNNPTGIGEWYETNQKYTGSRYGDSATYYNGKAYVIGGACGATLTYASPVAVQTTLLAQPQVAKYSIMIDTSSDVFPTYWLINGLDNSIGAEWQLKYSSMTNTTTSCTTPAMTTWGQVTNYGNVTLGTYEPYIPLNGSGVNTNCARFYYLNVSIDSSQAFGYPDDVTRGPTITDMTLQFTADPSKRLMHGRTFTGGLQQPDDTPYYTH
jgi:N-acetylneuraminic acid mutarotase